MLLLPPSPPHTPKVLSLTRVSERGARQLEADLKYLSNVFHALDLAPPPALEYLTMLVALGGEEAASHLAQETVAGERWYRLCRCCGCLLLPCFCLLLFVAGVGVVVFFGGTILFVGCCCGPVLLAIVFCWSRCGLLLFF